MRILSEKVVPAAEARLSLGKRKARRLGYEQRLARSFLQKHVKLPVVSARRLLAELKALKRVSDELAVSIVDLLPRSKEELNLPLEKEKFKLKPEEKDRIIDLVKKYSGL